MQHMHSTTHTTASALGLHKKKMKANCCMNNAEACRMQMQDTGFILKPRATKGDLKKKKKKAIEGNMRYTL